MIDHLVIRLWKNNYSILECPTYILNINEYITNLHFRIEEEVVYNMLIEFYGERDKNIINFIQCLSRDHKIIRTLVNNISRYVYEDKVSSYKNRSIQLLNLLVKHNLNEEDLLFVNWFKDIDRKRDIDAIKKGFKLIKEYGIDKYVKFTNLSKEYLQILNNMI